MNIPIDKTNSFINLNITSIVMLWISLFILTLIAISGSLTPIILYIFMSILAIVLIVLISDKNEISIKVKLFIFFFSVYLAYTLINYYILLSLYPYEIPLNYIDENTFYEYSNLGLPYIIGKKHFFDLFTLASYPLHEQPLFVMFISSIAYLSTIVDGNNTLIAQKILSPFLGGLFSVVLYSTLKYQFKETSFSLNATIAFGLFSAIFMYSTPIMRDIDVALAYMIFICLFLQKNSVINFILLLVVAFITYYLRMESGMVLFALVLLYSHFHVKTIHSKAIKFIFYILVVVFSSFLILLMANKIFGRVVGLNEANTARSIAEASAESISLIFNKLPFPLSYIAKVLFGQMQPFPFFLAIDRLPEAISGVFWPFIFIMMLYAVIKKEIRKLIDTKIIYLLIVAIAILFLMSSEPMARRMMSVYPIIYIVSLYVFLIVPNNKIKSIFSYYIFGIISLNIFYYFLKI